MDWFSNVQNIWIVPVYPLMAAFAIILGRWLFKPVFKKPFAMALTVGATFLGLLHAIGAIGWLMSQGAHVHAVEQNWSWLQAGNFTLSLGFLVDPMSVMMLFVVTFISMFIQIYTHGYMEHDEGYAKFFAYLALFNFSMLGLVLSTNLFQIYIFWELVGVCSYLLIGFWFTKKDAKEASIKAFLMNRVGDFGFLVGILGLLYFSFPLWAAQLAGHPEQALLSFTALADIAPQLQGVVGAGILTTIGVLLFMGPMAKSAQVPLHTWLPDAMAGPTPISALIHAATMVAAGVYLVGRIYPVLNTSESAMMFVALIGTLTAVIGATIALTQYDIKKALAYSTMSQLGYMVAAMGFGAFSAGLFHLFTHAFFKALLFLCSGSVIHACEDEQDMRQMGGLMSKLPVTGITYLIGTVAIAGLPMTSGFFSKDMILEGAKHYNTVMYWALVVTAALTAFYMFRTFFMTFMGKYRGKAHVHHENIWMTGPLMVLSVPALAIGYLLSGYAMSLPAFSDVIHYGSHHGEHPETIMGLLTGDIAVMSTVVVGIGILVSAIFYLSDAGAKIPAQLIKSFPGLYDLFCKKWYFDELYNGFVDYVYLAFARGSASFDKGGIDGIVNGTGTTVLGGGAAIRALQSGKVQAYVAVFLFGLACLSLFVYYLFL